MNLRRLIASTRITVAGICLSIPLTNVARAQEPLPGAVAVPPPSTVIKNRSPIQTKPLEVSLPAAREKLLANGMRIFLVEDHRTPLVTFTVSVGAGDLFEQADKRGVADLVASTLVEGTRTYSAERIATIADTYGASFQAGAGDERTSISLRCLSENVAELLPILAELVYEPVFPEKRVQLVRARAQASAITRQTDPNVLATDALRASLYGRQTPYGRPSVTSDQIGLVSISDMKMFHEKHFKPETTIIGVAGDVDEKEAITLLTSLFGNRKKSQGSVQELPPAVLDTDQPAKRPVATPIIINRPGSAQSVLNFGVPAIKRNDPDYFPLLLANRVLGGGFNSRLNQKLREEKGYTYGARSSVQAPKWTGIWTASASVRNAVTGDAAKDFIGEFLRLQTTPPKEGELALIKQSLIGNFALTLESPEAVLARSIERFEHGLPKNYWDNYSKNVRAVKPEDISRVARKYLGSAGDPTMASSPLVSAVIVGERAAIETEVKQALTELPAP